ncbi:phosphotransferase [Alcanivorax sp. DP30]|nr:phosphotransferase [Alcanivorax sp. DP30]
MGRGGDTAVSVKVVAKRRDLFAKIHENASLLMCEQAALTALSSFVKTPRVVSCSEIDGCGVLIMEYLQIHPPLTDPDWHALGRALAGLHGQSECEGPFGFDMDNYIGGSLQRNEHLSSWRDFFVQRRLGPQLELAWGLPESARRHVERVIARINVWLPADPPAALLHGDLWSGNLGLQGGEPVFYDPACYYGDPQADLAMMSLFGSVPDSFYLAYQGHLPDAEQQNTWRVYHLYHLLNHFNLFGSAYASSVERVARQLLLL